MKVEQIYNLMNTVTGEVLGKSEIVAEDLTNIVDIGKEIFDTTSVDNYVKTLVDHVGKVIFVNRKYNGNVPSILMDSWEFGSVVEKIQADIPEAQENESYDLVDKQSYDVNVFYKPSVSAKFYNKKITFEIPVSFTERQVKSSFDNANQLNSFLSMLVNAVEKSMTIKIDNLIMKTINNMIGQTLHKEFPLVADGDYSKSTGIKAVNLLKSYNDKYTKTLTVDTCLSDVDFIKYCVYTMGLYKDRLSKISTLFNVGGKERFTPNDCLKCVLLSEFEKSANVYLDSVTYHKENVALPTCDIVPYWQATGTDYSFNTTSDIHVNIEGSEGSPVEIVASGIVGVMFDKDSVGVCNTDKRVTTNYNAKAEFYNNYYKFEASYFNDLNENFVVFFIA